MGAAKQPSAPNSSSTSSSELSEVQRRLVMLEKENEKLRNSIDDILDMVEYLADRNLGTSERVLEKIGDIAR